MVIFQGQVSKSDFFGGTVDGSTLRLGPYYYGGTPLFDLRPDLVVEFWSKVEFTGGEKLCTFDHPSRSRRGMTPKSGIYPTLDPLFAKKGGIVGSGGIYPTFSLKSAFNPWKITPKSGVPKIFFLSYGKKHPTFYPKSSRSPCKMTPKSGI